MAATLSFCCRRVMASSLTFCLEEAKMMVRCGGFCLKSWRSMVVFCGSWQMYASCRMPSAGLERAMFISVGLWRSDCASCRMAGGMVAEKSMVWRVVGRWDAIFCMSS